MVDHGVLVRDFSRWPRLEGCLRVTIGTPDENDAFLAALRASLQEVVLHMTPRTSEQHRTTKETTIELALDVDGSGTASASTGIPFFDHMLEQLGKHGGFDLRIVATGDLEVDLHHTVEDVGIVLGTALKEALGDKAGRASLRRRRSCRSTRRSCRSRSTCRAARSSSTRSTRSPSGSAPSTRSSPRSSGARSRSVPGSRCTSGRCRDATATT